MGNSVNNDMISKGVHHVALKVQNYEEVIAFYENVLGFKSLYTWGEGDGRANMLKMEDGTILEVFAGGSESSEDNRYIHVAYHADDICGMYEKAIAHGAKSRSEPNVLEIDGNGPGKIHIAFVYGLAGEVIEFFKQI